MARGIPQIDRNKCKGCGLCMPACPKSILKFSEDYNKNGVNYAVCFDEEGCIACNNCAMMCPDSVIEIIRKS